MRIQPSRSIRFSHVHRVSQVHLALVENLRPTSIHQAYRATIPSQLESRQAASFQTVESLGMTK